MFPLPSDDRVERHQRRWLLQTSLTLMTDQFQHVMVLTSIIIGLGITHILVGIGSIIERVSGHGALLRLSWAHGAWLAVLFVWMVLFWWWQFRLLALVKVWTLGLYFFIILYAVLLFLLAVILIPRDWGNANNLDDYFLSKRYWFYTVFLMANVADFVDSFLKGGWQYLLGMGVMTLVFTAAPVPFFPVGVLSKNIRIHSLMAFVFLIWLVITGFEIYPSLGL